MINQSNPVLFLLSLLLALSSAIWFLYGLQRDWPLLSKMTRSFKARFTSLSKKEMRKV